jgi:hypothetical protein
LPAPDVRPVLKEFKNDVAGCARLLLSVRGAGFPFFQVELFAELSFLRMYVSWEAFLEESFSRFLCGARGISGAIPTSCVNPHSIEHAKSILVGLDRGGRYADWSRRDTVTARASLFFRDGAPFSIPLTAAARDLDDMRAIRDCIAHKSRVSKESVAKIVQRRTGVAHKYSAGRFLLKRPTQPGAPATFLDFFANTLVLIAERIAA